MKAYGWFKDLYEEARGGFEFELAGLELEITERILAVMDETGMSRSDLAEKLGISKAAVSKLLNNGSNLTLKTLLRISKALGCELHVHIGPANERKVLDDIRLAENE